MVLDGKAIEDFEEWAFDNPWNDYERDRERAIERTWKHAQGIAAKIALEERLAGSGFDYIGEPAKGQDLGITITMASEIELVPVDWIWKNHIAKGKGTLLTGLPKILGKSTISIDVAATISVGGKWPDGSRAPKGKVVVCLPRTRQTIRLFLASSQPVGTALQIGFIRQTVGVKGKRRNHHSQG